MGNWLQDEFFRIVIEEYTLPDINNLLQVADSEKGKCASPLGLYICQCMAFWGYLIAEDEYLPAGSTTEKIMSYLVLTLGNEEAALLRPAIEFCSIPYALLGTQGRGITVMESYRLFGDKALNIKELAKIFIWSLDELYKLLGDETIAARVSRRLKALKEG